MVNSKLVISKSSNSSTTVLVYYQEHVEETQRFSKMTPLINYVFTENVALVMVTNATTIEEQLASLTRAIEGFTKNVQEQDAQIARLINKTDNVNKSHIMGEQVEAHDEAEASTKQHYTKKYKSEKVSSLSCGSIPMDQLKEFIEGIIRSKIEGSSKSSYLLQTLHSKH
ncbi:UNVERIFIED_CONTAM: hypothetical protein Sangu_1172800 [Sesamum angustifolium]|uniref:Uncharacterized protein n=1 Tax=Sesamum angustifolium TaxID=2727405 RepID=A0AAW2P2L9_9LAMI